MPGLQGQVLEEFHLGSATIVVRKRVGGVPRGDRPAQLGPEPEPGVGRPAHLQLPRRGLAGAASSADPVSGRPGLDLDFVAQPLAYNGRGALPLDVLRLHRETVVLDAELRPPELGGGRELELLGAAPERQVGRVGKPVADPHPLPREAHGAPEESDGALQVGGEPARVGGLGVGNLPPELKGGALRNLEVRSRDLEPRLLLVLADEGEAHVEGVQPV